MYISYPPWTEKHILYWFSLVLRLKQLSWVSYISLKWVVLTTEVYWLPFVPECISHCEIRHLLGAVQTFCSGHTPSVAISRQLQGYKSYCSWLYSVPDTDYLHSGGGGASPHRLTKLRLLHSTNSPDSDLSTPLSWYGPHHFHTVSEKTLLLGCKSGLCHREKWGKTWCSAV